MEPEGSLPPSQAFATCIYMYVCVSIYKIKWIFRIGTQRDDFVRNFQMSLTAYSRKQRNIGESLAVDIGLVTRLSIGMYQKLSKHVVCWICIYKRGLISERYVRCTAACKFLSRPFWFSASQALLINILRGRPQSAQLCYMFSQSWQS